MTHRNAAVAANLAELMIELGNVPIERVRPHPRPGTATTADVLSANAAGAHCELVDGTLVEKAMGWRESLVAAFLVEILGSFVRRANLGFVSGPDGFVRILGSLVRGPDVAFVSWDRLPGRKVPIDSIPELVPDLAVEIISEGNTLAEMARKRREYFHAGVRLVWMVDPRARTVAVYSSITDYIVLDEAAILDGQSVLPGLQIRLSELFAELDRTPPTA